VLAAAKTPACALLLAEGMLAPAQAAGIDYAWALVPIAALAAGCLVLLAARPAVRETTLTSAWGWSLAALGSWSAVEIAACLFDEQAAAGWLFPLRLAAVALSFCPVVSLIGAKRPQNVAWNFIVLSLWGIVALPAAEAFFLNRGPRLEIGDARAWFLWILISLTPINFVATRYWLASLLFAAGQIVASSPHLALLQRPLTAWPAGVGLLLCAAGIGAAYVCRRRIATAPAAANGPYDRLWLDFRDSFGMLWALRVQERVNAAAGQLGWDLELNWNGFHRASDGTPLTAIDPAIEATLRTTLKGLLRRFVSNAWIARRLLSHCDTPCPPSGPPY
jgi:hypothetical protein